MSRDQTPSATRHHRREDLGHPLISPILARANLYVPHLPSSRQSRHFLSQLDAGHRRCCHQAGAPVCKARTPPTRLLRPAAHPSGPVNIRYFAGSSFVTHLLCITAMLPEIPTRHKRVQPSYSFASFCCARTRSRWMNSPPYLPVDRLTQATRARSLHLSTSALLRLFPTGVSPARPPPYHHVFRYRPSSVSALSSSLESHLSKSPISYRRLCSNVMAIP